ncbi:MAG: hypothetical protein K2K14_08855 [Ruminococcus sp.]|nr:hypothetical protein [Ruminococcus sp.]
MKKILSFVMSAAMAISSLTVVNVSAEDEKIENMVIFGDSIATGYGLDPKTEYSYGQICADYFGCNVENYAVDGLDSSQLCDLIENLNDEKKQAVSDADVVVISIGGNDIAQYSSKKILDFAAKKNLLKSGYTAADIPQNPGADVLIKMLNIKGEGGLKEYVNNDSRAIFDLNKELRALSMNLRLTEGTNAYGANEGIIHNKIMANIDSTVKMIDDINPDARIIVQTVYQPMQFSPEFIQSEYGTGGYSMMLTQLRETYNDIMNTFREELKAIDGIEIADVFYQFTALDKLSDSCNATPGYAYYFTNIQEPMEAQKEGGKTKDFHPNQKGHLAIAATIIDVIGVKNTNDDSLYTTVFNNIQDRQYYPTIAYKAFMNSGDLTPGDVNGDGLIDTVDATLILSEYARISAGKPETFSERQKVIANVNHEQFVDNVDSAIIRMYYAKISAENATDTGISTDIFEFLRSLQK